MPSRAEGSVGRSATAPIASRFEVGIAAACLVVAVMGFVPTYWLPLLRGSLDAPPIIHAHAVVFYGWTLLFLSQTWLIAKGRFSRHRGWGLFGVALATAMWFVGMAAAIHSLRQATAMGFGEAARAFAIVPVSGLLFFGVLFVVALRKVRQPDVHKRLMLVATVSLLQAPMGRWFGLLLAPAEAAAGGPPPVFITVLPGLTVDLLIVAAMIHDRSARGRVHPVYWMAGGALLALQLARVPASASEGWLQAAEWLSTISL